YSFSVSRWWSVRLGPSADGLLRSSTTNSAAISSEASDLTIASSARFTCHRVLTLQPYFTIFLPFVHASSGAAVPAWTFNRLIPVACKVWFSLSRSLIAYSARFHHWSAWSTRVRSRKVRTAAHAAAAATIGATAGANWPRPSMPGAIHSQRELISIPAWHSPERGQEINYPQKP